MHNIGQVKTEMDLKANRSCLVIKIVREELLQFQLRTTWGTQTGKTEKSLLELRNLQELQTEINQIK